MQRLSNFGEFWGNKVETINKAEWSVIETALARATHG
jgi:hypothetical protein